MNSHSDFIDLMMNAMHYENGGGDGESSGVYGSDDDDDELIRTDSEDEDDDGLDADLRAARAAMVQEMLGDSD